MGNVVDTGGSAVQKQLVQTALLGSPCPPARPTPVCPPTAPPLRLPHEPLHARPPALLTPDVLCSVVDGGTLSSRRHLNIRGKVGEVAVARARRARRRTPRRQRLRGLRCSTEWAGRRLRRHAVPAVKPSPARSLLRSLPTCPRSPTVIGPTSSSGWRWGGWGGVEVGWVGWGGGELGGVGWRCRRPHHSRPVADKLRPRLLRPPRRRCRSPMPVCWCCCCCCCADPPLLTSGCRLAWTITPCLSCGTRR